MSITQETRRESNVKTDRETRYNMILAVLLGINDTYFSKKLRYEFSPEKKAQIRAIIAELEAEE